MGLHLSEFTKIVKKNYQRGKIIFVAPACSRATAQPGDNDVPVKPIPPLAFS
jgi:hypothetical protein